MEQSINIEEVKRKTYRAIQQDGLDKILLGILFGLWSLIYVSTVWIAVVACSAVLAQFAREIIRKKLTYNRVGYVEFSKTLDKKETLFTLLSVTIFLSLLVTVIVTGFKALSPLLVVIIPSGIYFMITHYRSKAKIDYMITILFLLSGVIGLFFTLHGYDTTNVLVVQISGLGVVLLTIGIVQFIRFLRNYPKQTVEASNVFKEKRP